MAEIKFHKAEELPSPLNSTHDGVWFIQEGRTFKTFIVSDAFAFPLNYDDATGSYVAGDGIDITDDEISLKKATDLEIGGTKIWKGTQAQYDAIPTKDVDTLYFVEDLGGSSNMAVYDIDIDLVIPSSVFDIAMFDNIPAGINISGAVNWEITWKESLNELKKLSSLANLENLYIFDNPTGLPTAKCRLRGNQKTGSSITISKNDSPKLILYYE